MRKVLLFLIIFISATVLILRFGYKPLIDTLGIKPRAGLRVEANIPADVYLGDKKIGATPLQNEDLTEGQFLLRITPQEKAAEASDSAREWQGYVKLNGGTLTVVNRDLQANPMLEAGEVITLADGSGATIVSTPNQAEVLVDGKSVGRTPLSISSLSPGEHQFIISKDNFVKRSIRANLVDGFSLNLAVDLAMTEPDLTKLQTTPTVVTDQLTVKATPTGFLRVRSTASTGGVELGRVLTGETLTLLEELEGWYKVRTADGKEGYVSSIYVEKKNN